jgi:hypothetical protein
MRSPEDIEPPDDLDWQYWVDSQAYTGRSHH